jgi:hypothetical protein
LKRLGGVAQAEVHGGRLEKPNGVVMAVFCISSGWTGIWLYTVTRSILEQTERPKSWWE